MRKSTQLLGLAVAGLLWGRTATHAQCIDCGTGADGVFNATTNTTLAGGTYNYSSFTIASGVTVSVTGTQPLVIKVTGAVSIDGVLNASGGNGAPGVTYASGGAGGIGVAGGGDGGAGSFHASLGPIDGVDGAGPGLGQRGIGWCGGGGAGYANSGSSSGGASGGFGGAAYGDPQLNAPNLGSGGGGGSGGYNCGAGGGGAGGGYISIFSCGTITIGAAGQILANGGNGGSDGTGNCGGGGGGSGGSIWLRAGLITHIGQIIAMGGTGGASNVAGAPYFGTGAAGSAGRIRIDGTIAGGSGNTQPAPFTGTATSFAISLSATDPACGGGSDGQATVVATSGSIASVLWSSGATTTTAAGLSAGCYTVQVTDSSNCTLTDSICILEPPVLQAAVSGTNTPCAGTCLGTASASVSGGTGSYAYAWSGLSSTTDTIGGLCAGSYVLTVTDSLGCTASDTIAIEEPAALSVSLSSTASTTTTSNDGTATNTSAGGTPPYTYMWTPGGGTTATINGLAPGLYSCVTTDANGCTDSSTVLVDLLIGLPSRLEFLGVSAYPNPSAGMLTVKVENPRGLELVLEAIDMRGRVLKRVALDGAPALEQVIDASQWADGNYLILLSSPEGQAVERVRIAR